MTARFTAVAIDVLRAGNPKARATVVAADILRAQGPAEEVVVDAAGMSVAHDEVGPLDTVVTQLGAEAIVTDPAPEAIITQLGAEAVTTGVALPQMTQHGVEVIYKVFPGCEDQPIAWRIRIRNADDSDDEVVFTSLATGANAVIVKEPSIDASRIDPITGKTDTGSCTVEIADATPDDCDSENDGTVRQFTQYLATDEGKVALLSRRTLVEVTTDDGESWAAYWGGFISEIRYPDAITVFLSLTTTTREDTTREVWKGYSSAFPNGACMLGGPVITGVPSPWPSVRVSNNEGQWVGKVIGVYPTHIDMDIDEDASGAFPPSDLAPFLGDNGFIRVNNDDAQRNVFKWAERQAQPYFVRDARFGAPRFGWYPRVDVDVNIKNGVPFSATFPMVAAKPKLVNVTDTKVNYATLFNGNLGNGFAMAWPDDAAIPQPAVNDVLHFYARPRDVSPAAPLWVTGHPVDILLALWDEAGYLHSGGGSTKLALGPDEVTLRITKPMTMSDAQQMLCGAFGFGWRASPNGVRTLFPTRVRTEPVATITINDLVSDDGVVWEVDERSRLFSIAYKWKRFERWPSVEDPQSTDRALDGVIQYDEPPIIFTSVANEPYGARTQEYDIPGRVLTGAGFDTNPDDVTAVLVQSRLASFGDGMVETTIAVRPTVTVLEGQEAWLDLPHRPGFDVAETPVAQRGLPERCLCIARVVHPWGQTLTFVRIADTGDPLEVDPTEDVDSELGETAAVTGAPAAANPATHITLTNADNTGYGADYRIDVAYAVQATEPAVGVPGTVIAEQWDAFSDLTFDIGPFPPQSKVWVRTRLTDIDTGQVDDWSAWQDIDLDPLEGQTDGGGLQTPTVTFSVDGSWNVSAAVEGGPDAVKAYCLGSTSAFPSVVSLLLSSPDAAAPFTFATVVAALTAGQTAYIAAVTEDADGNISLRGVAQYTRPASGGGGGSVTHPFAKPVAADFTTANGLTLTDRAQTMGMSAAGTYSGGDPVPRAQKAKPGGATWDIAAHFFQSTPGKNFYGAGLMLRDSAGGNHYQFLFINNSYHSAGPAIQLMKNSNDQIYTGFGGETLVVANVVGLRWMRIRDDGTDVFFEVSGAAGEWVSVYSEGRTAHVPGGGDEVGLVLWPWAESGTLYDGKVDVLHFGPTPTHILPY